MKNSEWTLIDIETSGLAAPIYALEIAGQRMRGLQPQGDPFQVFLNHEIDVPEEAEAVHGYSRRFLEEKGVSPLQAHLEFAEYVGDTPVCAYNLPFDYDLVLMPERRRLGLGAGITQWVAARFLETVLSAIFRVKENRKWTTRTVRHWHLV